MSGTVLNLARDGEHRFSKSSCPSFRLVAGLGVEGDAHAGVTVKHRSRVAKYPYAPNLRQVHLIQVELLEELAMKGFAVEPGQLGENITTRGIDLLTLSRGTHLRLGVEALIEVTGLRNPCNQINGLAPGLMNAVLDRGPNGELIRKCGVMAVVLKSGEVRRGDAVTVEWQPDEWVKLDAV